MIPFSAGASSSIFFPLLEGLKLAITLRSPSGASSGANAAAEYAA